MDAATDKKYESVADSTLFETVHENYSLKILVKNGQLLWEVNNKVIMFGGHWKCHLVDYANLQGTNNEILVGGLGFGNTSEAAVKHGNVTTVELLPELVNFYQSIMSHVPLTIEVDNMYHYVNKTNKRFDAVIFDIDLMGVADETYILASNKHMVAKEYIAQLKRILKPNGALILKATEPKRGIPEMYHLLSHAGFTINRHEKREIEGDPTSNRMVYQCFNTKEVRHEKVSI